MNARMLDHVRAIGVALLLSGPAWPSVLRAQLPSAGFDTRWHAALGCWRSADAAVAAPSRLLCVVPVSPDSGVDLITVIDGSESMRQRLHATADQRPVMREGCTGWERARWSRDNRRVYVRSDLTCPGALGRVSTRVLAISPEGDLLDIESVTAGGGTGLRVDRYRDAGVPSNLPFRVDSALTGRGTAVSAARIAAGAPITPSDVLEASQALDGSVVQALLVERGQPFRLDAKQLVSLADAGVPAVVTDAMVAVSYPRTFVLNPVTRRYGMLEDSTRGGGVYAGALNPAYFRTGCSALGWGLDPWGFNPWPNSMYGLAPGCGRYGYNAYGYNSFGGSWYWNRTPYVIVVRNAATTPSGQAVKGRGYTRRGSTATGSAGASTRARGSASGRGSTGATRSGGSGRTAKPRP